MSIFDRNKTGKDNHFNAALRVGFISKPNPNEASHAARVVFPDKDNLVSKPYPVMQRAAGGSQDYDMPAMGEQALVATLANGPEEGFILGTFYSASSPPPTTDINKRLTRFADGTIVEYDKATHVLTIDAAGPLTIRTVGPVDLIADGAVNLRSASSVTITAPTVVIEGDLVVNGDVSNTGNMATEGTHVDATGTHG
jgi:phage baseplate assembly protein V